MLDVNIWSQVLYICCTCSGARSVMVDTRGLSMIGGTLFTDIRLTSGKEHNYYEASIIIWPFTNRFSHIRIIQI